MRDLAGKVAVVTGAASGIGLAIASACAERGMRVVLADIEEEALDNAVSNLGRADQDVAGVVTDVTDADEVEALAKATVDRFGKVHLLVNNAGVNSNRRGVSDTTIEDWRWVFEVNFWGVLHGIRAFLPLLEEHGEGGHIVNTASIGGLITFPWGPYVASKHAVVALSEALHLELRDAASTVGVSVLCPGFVRTRIAESERNRPAEFTPEHVVDRSASRPSSFAPPGLSDPEPIAAAVLAGIEAESFYVLPHPGSEMLVRERMDRLLSGKMPAVPDLWALQEPGAIAT